MINSHPIINDEIQKTLALGFIGVGWIGRNRMDVLLKHPHISAVAITDPHQQNADDALKAAPTAKLRESADVVHSDETVDGIVIATPSALHAQQAIDALKAGKAVFCQKPLGRNAKEVAEVIQASREANKLLAIDLSYRYTKAYQAIHNLIQNGEIGKVHSIDLVFHNAYGPDKDWFYDLERSGGGCVMDLGIHLIDLALWTLGFPEIKGISAHLFHNGKKMVPAEKVVEDFAHVLMTAQTGTVISLQCSWNISAGKDAVIEATFFGTQGGAAFKNVNGSFYDFVAEKYTGTHTETLVSSPDDWGGRAGILWAEAVMAGKGHDALAAKELMETAKIIDRIYGK